MVGGGGQGTRNGYDGRGTMSGIYRSGDSIPTQGGVEGMERTLRESMRELSQLRQSLGESPELAQDVQELMRELQKYDPSRIANDPQLAERIRSAVIPNIQQLELQLRRKLDEKSGDVRSSSAERVPQGYGDAVAEYFRRLSKGR
jgi:hypothetical protein